MQTHQFAALAMTAVSLTTGAHAGIAVECPSGVPVRPLDTVLVRVQDSGAKLVRVYDAEGVEYAVFKAAPQIRVRVSGLLGTHVAAAFDEKSVETARATFRVDCKTEIDDNGGAWTRLMGQLRWNNINAPEKLIDYRDTIYRNLSGWVRDGAHIAKSKKYFSAYLKGITELYGETQHEDGMVYDHMPAKDPQQRGTHLRFSDPKYARAAEGERNYFERIPVEADVEYLYVEGLYHAWKAGGDTEWMKRYLPNAEKALRYSCTDAVRWSKKYNLVKRAYTIDTWDFQNAEDAARSRGDIMEIDTAKTQFGVFHGDNTGVAASSRFLAEMLEAAGEPKRAREWRERADKLLAQLGKVSWNGQFFTHWVPEDASVKRDLGVDEAAQVSLSNAYALNRGISHEQAVAILKTYQRIRREMPASSVGEWFGIYPPFERGFDFKKWHYVNGGIFPLIGGELSHGAFEHGYEAYGVDILRRISDLLTKYSDTVGNDFPYYYIGAIEPAPTRTFETVSLKTAANADLSGTGGPGVPGWSGQGTENDFSVFPTGAQSFHDVPFDVIDPSSNGRRAAVALAASAPYQTEVSVPVGKPAASLYFLHTMTAGEMPGWVTLRYADGTSFRKYVNPDSEIRNWWRPTDVPYVRTEGWKCRVAWAGFNKTMHVGAYVWGLNNPHPRKPIVEVTFTHSQLSPKWFILGVTISDKPVYFTPPAAIYGNLRGWHAGAVTYALLEGLAGIKDQGVTYSKVKLAPRWCADTGVSSVRATARYEASNGYVRYEYLVRKDCIKLSLASNADAMEIELLIPKNTTPGILTVNEEAKRYTVRNVESSSYVCFNVERRSPKEVLLTFK